MATYSGSLIGLYREDNPYMARDGGVSMKVRTMATATTTTDVTPPFTGVEQRALRALRACYQQDRDLFGSRELAHLRFLRWLYQTGRVAR